MIYFCFQQDDWMDANDINASNWPPTDWYAARNPSAPPPTRYGLSGRPDLPPPRPPPSSGLNFVVFDPVTRQRTTAVDRNCTATGCCVPKCFAEKGSRVS